MHSCMNTFVKMRQVYEMAQEVSSLNEKLKISIKNLKKMVRLDAGSRLKTLNSNFKSLILKGRFR